jgi:hypothetical protein
MGLLYLMIALLEFAAMMTVANSLEAATNLSSRLGKTGYVDAESTQKETIRAEIERRVGPLIDMDKLDIESEAYSDFGDVGSPEPWNDIDEDGEPDPGEWTDSDGDNFCDGCSGLGGADNVVVFTITYPWDIMTPAMSMIMGSEGVVNLTAVSVVKNEPY